MLMAVLLGCSPGFAATYACKSYGGTDKGVLPEIDQIEFDPEAKVLELRVAKTIGTKEPKVYPLTDDASKGDEMILRKIGPTTWVGAGIRDNYGSYSFRFNGQILFFSDSTLFPAASHAWDCHE
jgi:hypothetical protein